MKPNKNIVILVFFILLLMIGAVLVLRPKTGGSLDPFLNGASRQQRVLIYFSKSKGSENVTEPVMRDMPKPKPESSEALMSYAMSELLKGPTDKEHDHGYFSEIPEGTKLLSVKETPKEISIDLSNEFASGGGSNSMVQRLQEVVKTAVSVPQKKPVYLKVDGKQLEALGGEGVMVNEPITADPSVTQ